jgi:hypothetical protein
MNLKITNYLDQKQRWPKTGKHIMAQYTDEYVVVYQAYRPEFGYFAAENQFFGGAFSYSRMSWIKPNFLWMMFRCGWGVKEGQEVTLAIKLKRHYFDSILLHAVEASFNSSSYESRELWQSAVQNSNVRLQWDPDHDPYGEKQERRAIQLGLRSDFLLPFKGEGIMEIENISEFVSEQRYVVNSGDLEKLLTPEEKIYVPKNMEAIASVGLDVVKELYNEHE